MSNRRLVTVGVLLGVFLAGIEGTVVSTAMPTAVEALGGLDLYSWVFASYMLFAAVSMPIFGKLSDVYGRKRLFVIGVVAFVVGSLLAGTSGSMEQLVAFRALQGVGGGAMFALPYTILGVVYPPEERGKAMGYGSAVWGVSSVVGPLLGFLLVETLGWRWVFYVSLPVGVAAVAIVWYALEESTGEAAPRVDYVGSLTLVVGLGAFLVGLQFVESGGLGRPALLSFGVGAVGLGGFYVAECRAAEPILPPSLFRDRIFAATNTVAFLTSFAVFAAIAYVPLFVQSARGGAGGAALAVFPVSIGWSGASIVAGRVVADAGERRLVLAGTATMTAGFVAAALWSAGTPLAVVMATMFVVGVGMGCTTIPLLTAIQNHFGAERMGIATSSQQFFRNLGGTVGVSVLGFVMTLAMRDRLAEIEGVSTLGDLRERLLGAEGAADPGAVAGADLLPVLAYGLTRVFLVAVGVCLLSAALARYVPRSSTDSAAGGSPPRRQTTDEGRLTRDD